MCEVHDGLGRFVTAQAEAAGTLNKLSGQTGISFKTLRGMIDGKHSPSLKTLLRLADGTGHTLKSLVQSLS